MTTTDATTESVPGASAGLVSPTDVGGRGLTGRQAKTLLRLLRAAYPHPSFPDAPYERTAKTIEDAGRSNDALVDGLDDLDARAGGDFAALDDGRATAIITDIAETPFFSLVHSTTVVGLYDGHEVWDLLGYEGASFDKGGYLRRGFDDLDWLPDRASRSTTANRSRCTVTPRTRWRPAGPVGDGRRRAPRARARRGRARALR